MKYRTLSKSRILSGLRCPKRMYLEVHKPELADVSEDTERKFAVGHQVGEMARKQFPRGIMVRHQYNLSEAIKETARLLAEKDNVTVYKGTFAEDGVLVRADIFTRENQRAQLIEVKASTGLKDDYLNDLAIQALVINEAGYSLDSICLAHVYNGFIYQGDENYSGLFKYVEVKNKVQPLVRCVPNWIRDFKQVLSGDVPDIVVGTQCNTPNECPFFSHCCPEQPEYPVSILPRGGAIVDELLSEGVEDVRHIPDGRLSKELHKKVRRVSIAGVPEISPELIGFMKGLTYPRYFLDFETAQFAVPVWKGTRPYEQLPVQWSCHIENESGDIEHKEFLDISGNPPMMGFIESLVQAVRDQGPILVYSSFEKTILRKLAEMFPEQADGIEKIIGRLVDLLPIVRNGYYHPEMKGSWSIKAVLPCVAPELNYAALEEIHEGGAAQAAYLEAIAPETTDKRRNEIRDRLLEYCKTDTLALVKLVRLFSKQ